jgi:flagellar basal-body rod modification protein FlgD
MTSPIPGTTPTPISQVLGQGGATTTAGSSEMSQDAFLKLLVAQLRYQDPGKPADGTQFVAQTAQFTQIEKLNALVTGQQQLLNAQLMVGASTLIGRTVSYTPAGGGDQVTGRVSSVTLAGSNPTVRVGNTDVPLSSVKEVRDATNG